MKYKILEMLETDKYVSGEEISKQLGISRNAVWKHINALRKMGCGIESIPSKGYRLTERLDIINPQLLQKYVPGKVYYYESVDSTNAACKREEDVADRSLFISDTQTGGRGRLGRKWSSPKGGSVFMSICLQPDIARPGSACSRRKHLKGRISPRTRARRGKAQAAAPERKS